MPLIINGQPQTQPTRLRRIARVALVGVGFLCDAYDLFVINLVIHILASMSSVYGPQTTSDTQMLAVSALAGAIAGQLLFGSLADFLGRRVIFIVTCSLIVVGGTLSSVAYPNSHIYVVLTVWRIILGIGIGGEYPLSATITSESSTNEARGRAMLSVFSMQAVGMLTCALLVYALVTTTSLEFSWRFALGFGALCPLLALYPRYRMNESAPYAEVRERDRTETGNEKYMGLMCSKAGKVLRQAGWRLLGTAGSWLLFDITFYANGLLQATITSLMGLGGDDAQVSLTAIYMALMAIPGFIFAILFINRIGRKYLQMFGFLMLGILYLICGLAFNQLKKIKPLFMFLCAFRRAPLGRHRPRSRARLMRVRVDGLTYFFSNFGPNSTTYVIPGEIFPTRIRSTCSGISAASGKLGALIGTLLLDELQARYGVAMMMITCGVVAWVGFFWTIWLVRPASVHARVLRPPSRALTDDRSSIDRWGRPRAGTDAQR